MLNFVAVYTKSKKFVPTPSERLCAFFARHINSILWHYLSVLL